MLTIKELAGKNIPTPGDCVFVVRRALKRNKNGRYYQGGIHELEVVCTHVTSIEIIRDINDDLQWHGTAIGNVDKPGEFSTMTVVEGDFAYDEDTALELLEKLKETGLQFDAFTGQLKL